MLLRRQAPNSSVLRATADSFVASGSPSTAQGWNCIDDLGRPDLLLDIGTEELSHLEVVGALIRMHLKLLKTNREAAEADPLVHDRRRRRRGFIRFNGQRLDCQLSQGNRGARCRFTQ
jgi:Manganese containing catalase